jgi:hypothetical protein
MPKMCAVYPCTRFPKPPDRETQHPGEIDAPWCFLLLADLHQTTIPTYAKRHRVAAH